MEQIWGNFQGTSIAQLKAMWVMCDVIHHYDRYEELNNESSDGDDT